MNKAFENLFVYTKRLRERYINIFSAFVILEEFNKMSAPNIVGQKNAERNVNIFGDYRYFFIPIKEASRFYFFIELAKFFDLHKKPSGKSLSIYKIINYAENHVANLTKQDFLKFHKNRNFQPELFQKYKPLSVSDLNHFKQLLNKNENIINKLKTYRDKYLAHDDIDKIKILINVKEVKILMNLIKEFIEFLYNKLDFSINSYVVFEKEPVRHLHSILETLINVGKNERQKNRAKS